MKETEVRLSPACGEAQQAASLLREASQCVVECQEFIKRHPDKNLILLPSIVSCDGPNLDGSCGAKFSSPAVEEIL